jgi:hypothetical protein
MSSTERTSVSLPVDLAEWARERSGGNVSGYIAGLIARDKRRAAFMQLSADAGYVGENAITEAGIARMGERLHALNARRAGKRTGT